jgi:hypothetical protein
VPSAPSSERTAPGGARATHPSANYEIPTAIKVVAGLLVLSGFGDAFLGLLTIQTTGVLGVLLLGVALAELYLAYGCYHLQEWAYRGTIVLQVSLFVVVLLLDQVAIALLKFVLVTTLVSKHDAGWY